MLYIVFFAQKSSDLYQQMKVKTYKCSNNLNCSKVNQFDLQPYLVPCMSDFSSNCVLQNQNLFDRCQHMTPLTLATVLITVFLLGIYYLPSHRTGSMVMIFRDNKYWINNRYHNTINWTCRDRKRLGCNSCVQTTVEGRYLKHKGYHNHDDNYTKYNFND